MLFESPYLYYISDYFVDNHGKKEPLPFFFSQSLPSFLGQPPSKQCSTLMAAFALGEFASALRPFVTHLGKNQLG
ncbi:MAG: hypothetical protein WCL90_05445 [Planctomycetota bacterium]